MPRDRYIFAGGGTGGHLYPGLAVAEALAERDPESLVVFACSERRIDRDILGRSPWPFAPQPVRPVPRRPWHGPGFLRAWWASARLARRLIADLRPRAVLGLGGFAAGPVVAAAGRAGIPAALLNPDAVPGKANRFLARRSAAIFTQFPAAGEHFDPRDRGKVAAVGCPVRRCFTAADRNEAFSHFQLDPDRGVLLVCGGSSGARLVNLAAAELAEDIARLDRPWQVLHISGAELYDETVRAWRGAAVGVKVLPFCRRMELAYAAADLAVARGGASTVAELAETATPAVILPYPFHADRQQELNAGPLVECGSAVRVEDSRDVAANAQRLRQTLLPLLGEPAKLSAMREAAGQAPRRAADAVADWLAGR